MTVCVRGRIRRAEQSRRGDPAWSPGICPYGTTNISIIYSLLSIIFFFFPMPEREGENKPDMSTYYKVYKVFLNLFYFF